jgi:hypothetical protein
MGFNRILSRSCFNLINLSLLCLLRDSKDPYSKNERSYSEFFEKLFLIQKMQKHFFKRYLPKCLCKSARSADPAGSQQFDYLMLQSLTCTPIDLESPLLSLIYQRENQKPFSGSRN